MELLRADTAGRDRAVGRPSWLLAVGPEGGFGPKDLFPGFITCHLGPRVLRTETASLAALAMIMAVAGDATHRPERWVLPGAPQTNGAMHDGP